MNKRCTVQVNKTKSSSMEERNYLAPSNMHNNSNRSSFVALEEEHNMYNTWGNSSSCCSWPARNYCCSFCKREFRSAQALGGHMNVHRRDRARLRSSSWVSSSEHYFSPNNKPSPATIKPNNSNNPNTTTHHDYLSSSSSSSPLHCLTLSSYSSASISGEKKPRLESHQVPILSPPISRGEIKMKISKNNTARMSTTGGLGGVLVEGLKGFAAVPEDNEHYKKVLENNNDDEHNNIALELGIGLHKHPNDEKMLDLELRLGHGGID